MRRSIYSLLVLPVIAACATVGGSGSDGNMALAYTVPSSGTLRYEVTDNMVIQIDAMGQVMEIPQVGSATIGMTFAQTEGGVRVTTDWEAWESVMSNPMGAPERGSLNDVDGSLIFDMSRTGAGTVVELPDMRGMSENLLDPESIVHSFFPRLPARAATAGMTWTDTIAYVSERAGTYSDITTVAEYMVVGDTTVAGKRLLRVNYTGVESMEMEGAQMGMSFTQSAGGNSRGWFLWDQATGVMVENHFEADIEGLMETDAIPVPLPMMISLRKTIRLLPGM